VARGFKRRDGRYVARLDAVERGLVVGLMEQVLELVEPAGGLPDEGDPTDEFDRIVSGLGGVGLGVSLSAADQVPSLEAPGSPDTGEHDPALDRIFPDGNRQDPQVAAEFRRLTEDGLRARKSANLTTAIAALGGIEDQRVSLDHEQALALVVALTDVRLVLGERLGLRHDDDFELLEEQASGLAPDDPAVYALAVYDFLTWLQETLAHALNR
jgi:hypothetical protein